MGVFSFKIFDFCSAAEGFFTDLPHSPEPLSSNLGGVPDRWRWAGTRSRAVPWSLRSWKEKPLATPEFFSDQCQDSLNKSYRIPTLLTYFYFYNRSIWFCLYLLVRNTECTSTYVTWKVECWMRKWSVFLTCEMTATVVLLARKVIVSVVQNGRKACCALRLVCTIVRRCSQRRGFYADCLRYSF